MIDGIAIQHSTQSQIPNLTEGHKEGTKLGDDVGKFVGDEVGDDEEGTTLGSTTLGQWRERKERNLEPGLAGKGD